jgi:phenylacetate-CoA ligase
MLLFRKFIYLLLKPSIFKDFKKYKNHDSLTKEYIDLIQFKLLQGIILYAYKNVPFYKKLWDKHSININIKTLKDFEKFPIITKEQIKTAIIEKQYSTKYIDSPKLVWQSTTGSSGQPLCIPMDIESENKKNSLTRRVYSWYGRYFGTVSVRLWRGPYKKNISNKLIEFLKGEYTISIYDINDVKNSALNEKRISEIIDTLNKIKPEIIDGFVSALELVSKHIIRHNIKLKFTPKIIVTGAELLTDTTRDTIKKAFQTTVVNRYGGTEISVVANECMDQANSNHYLHIQSDRVLIETYIEKKKVINIEGNFIVTDLTNKAFPIIKYDIGDKGILTDQTCSCSLPYPLISKIIGRSNDFFIKPDGSLITSHFFQNIMKKYDIFDLYIMTQHKRNHISIKYKKNKNYFNEKKLELLLQEFSNLFNTENEEVVIEAMQDDTINPFKNGKLRNHICETN